MEAVVTTDTAEVDVHLMDEGEWKIWVWAFDNAGNQTESTFDVNIDETAPVTTSDALATYVDSATITLSAEDATSGVDKTYYRIGAGDVMEYGDALSFGVGTHTLEFWSVDVAGNVEDANSVTFTVSPAVIPPTPTDAAERLSGADRYATAVRIAREAYPGFAGLEYVIVASGEDRSAVDALAAAGLSGTLDAPILLVQSNGIPSATRSAIASMPQNVTVIIVGGTSAVSRQVGVDLDAIRTVAGVQRAAGADRYATARAVAERMKAELGPDMPTTALLANGAETRSFFDALALSAISANNNYPILLLQRDSVPADTAAALRGQNLTTRIIGGGPVVVSDAVQRTLNAERWWGADRYATAAEIARRASARGWASYGAVGVAAALPDALTGGAAIGGMEGVLLLTQTDLLPAVTATAIRTNRGVIEDLYIFGGTRAVSDPVRVRINSLLK